MSYFILILSKYLLCFCGPQTHSKWENNSQIELFKDYFEHNYLILNKTNPILSKIYLILNKIHLILSKNRLIFMGSDVQFINYIWTNDTFQINAE